MTWARLDDRFYSNRKVMRAWKLSRASVGLHTMALAWCCGHELDGHVDEEFVESVLPKDKERAVAVDALVAVGLWHRNGTGWVINDFLEYNPSAASLREKRRKEAERKAQARSGASTRTDGGHA
jgi:hypothetical protein